MRDPRFLSGPGRNGEGALWQFFFSGDFRMCIWRDLRSLGLVDHRRFLFETGFPI
jgi:hypothetical protein